MMRKTPLNDSQAGHGPALDAWLDLESVAAVELSSEDPTHPFENALHGETGAGWQAATPGRQKIRVQFDKPTPIRRIRLEFRETRRERAQEFRLSAVSASGEKREIVRQQWNFSPGGATTEVEDYRVNLPEVASVELEIDPGRHDGDAVASLQSFAIA